MPPGDKSKKNRVTKEMANGFANVDTDATRRKMDKNEIGVYGVKGNGKVTPTQYLADSPDGKHTRLQVAESRKLSKDEKIARQATSGMRAAANLMKKKGK